MASTADTDSFFPWDELPREMHAEIVERFSFFPWGLATKLMLAHTNKTNFKKFSLGFIYNDAHGRHIDLLASALAAGKWGAFLFLCPEPLNYFHVTRQTRAFFSQRRKLTAFAGFSGDLAFIKQWHFYLFGNVPKKKARREDQTHLASTVGMLPYRSLYEPMMRSIEIWEERNDPLIRTYCKEDEKENFGNMVAKFGTGADMAMAVSRGYRAAKFAFEEACLYGNVSVATWMIENKPLVIFYNRENFERSMKALVKGLNRGPIAKVLFAQEEAWPYIADATVFKIADGGSAEDILEVLIEDPRVSHSLDNNLPYVVKKKYTRLVEKLLSDPLLNPNDFFLSESAIGNAVRSKNMEVVRFLISHPLFDPRADTKVLEACVGADAVDILRFLLSDERFGNINIVGDGLLRTALLSENSVETAKFLISHGGLDPVPALNLLIPNLFFSAELLKFILEDGRADPGGHTSALLRNAVARNRVDIVKLLLADARVDPASANGDALLTACRSFSYEILELLVAHPRINGTFDSINNAIQFSGVHPRGLLVLISHPDAKPSARRNAALKAFSVNTGYLDQLKILLSHPKTDPTIDGHQILLSAISRGREETVQLLLEDGRIDPSQKDNECLRTARLNDSWWSKKIIQHLLKDPRVMASLGDSVRVYEDLQKFLREPKAETKR